MRIQLFARNRDYYRSQESTRQEFDVSPEIPQELRSVVSEDLGTVAPGAEYVISQSLRFEQAFDRPTRTEKIKNIGNRAIDKFAMLLAAPRDNEAEYGSTSYSSANYWPPYF